MKSDKRMPLIAKTLIDMHASEAIPTPLRRAEIRARLIQLATPFYLSPIETKLGWITVAYSAHGVIALDFPRATRELSLRELRREYSDAVIQDAPPQVAQELREYAKGRCRKFDLSIDWSSIKPFQRAVLQAAFRIPFGETRTYAWIAQKIGKPRAVRAVGHALGTNPIPILLPCHRVIGSDGGLHGYRGGLKMKARLLKLEGAQLL
jgi:methylated-DNA-[protein]-cysteine S-methyltransferase